MRAYAGVAVSTILLALIQSIVSLRGPVCHDAVVPPLTPRGVNAVSNNTTRPLYKLEVTPKENSGSPGVYEVRITAHPQAYAFTDATISMATEGACGKGELEYASNDYFSVQQDDSCPQVLLTNRKTPMLNIPHLVLTAPSCGCIHTRVVLILASGKYYYTEIDDVTTGPLAKRICAEKKQIQMTKEQRLDALCHVTEKHSTREILSSVTFRRRHQLDILYTDSLELEMALELRRADARLCCAKPGQEEKLKCFQTVWYRRADRFCKDGFPDIPFVAFRAKFMRDKERRCCSILGMYRYLCFAMDSQLERGSDVTPLDFSLDATDPLNDLAELGTLDEFNELLEKYQPASAEKREGGQREKETSVRTIGVREQSNNPKQPTVSSEHLTTTTQVPKNVPQTAKEIKILPKTSSGNPNSRALPTGEINNDNKNNDNNNDKNTGNNSNRNDKNKNNIKEDLKPQSKPENSDLLRRPLSGSKSAPRQPTGAGSLERRKSRRKSTVEGRSRHRGLLRRTSVERKTRGRFSAERRSQKAFVDNVGSLSRNFRRNNNDNSNSNNKKESNERRFTNVEKRLRGTRGFGRVQEAPRGATNVMEDFDDQGGNSVDNTLNYLAMKMKRLELRRLCCLSGGMFGEDVYGKLSMVTDECTHSSHKYLQREMITFGVKMCRRQFVKCCVDEAKMGLTMSSSEFDKKTYDVQPDLLRRSDPEDGNRGLLLRRGMARTDRWGSQPEADRKSKDVVGGAPRDILDAESDKRFESMRADVDDPRFEAGEDFDEDEEYTGPRRFDNEDNREIDGDDVMSRQALGKEERPHGVPVAITTLAGNRDDNNAANKPETNGVDDNKQKIGSKNVIRDKNNDDGDKDDVIDPIEGDSLNANLSKPERLRGEAKGQEIDSKGNHEPLIRLPVRKVQSRNSPDNDDLRNPSRRSKPRNSREQVGASSRRKGGFSRRGNVSSKRLGGYSRRLGGISRRLGISSKRRGGSSRRQGGSSRRQGGSSRRQGGSSRRQGGSSRRQGGSSRRQGGSSRRQGGYSKQQGRSSRRRAGGYSRLHLKADANRNRRPYKQTKMKRQQRTKLALDSKELAAAHEDRMPTALDSKEMAAKYEEMDKAFAKPRRRTSLRGRNIT